MRHQSRDLGQVGVNVAAGRDAYAPWEVEDDATCLSRECLHHHSCRAVSSRGVQVDNPRNSRQPFKDPEPDDQKHPGHLWESIDVQMHVNPQDDDEGA